MYSQKDIAQFVQKEPLLKEIMALKPVTWINSKKKTMLDMPDFSITKEDMANAEALWDRFAPFFAEAFPETQKTHGRSEEHTSELQSRENLVCRLLLEKKKTKK